MQQIQVLMISYYINNKHTSAITDSILSEQLISIGC